MGTFTDLTGSRFGSLVALRAERVQGRWHWLCGCDCGAVKSIIARALTRASKPTVSCGCAAKKAAALTCQKRTKHGQSKGGKRTRALSIWSSMMDRCYREGNQSFKDYGARGIYVDARWHSFETFLADMGQPPDRMSLERKDNNGPYSKDNCVWATQSQQMRNTRRTRMVTFNGHTKSLAAWCEELGLKYYTTHSRITRQGWSVEQAFGATQ